MNLRPASAKLQSVLARVQTHRDRLKAQEAKIEELKHVGDDNEINIAEEIEHLTIEWVRDRFDEHAAR